MKFMAENPAAAGELLAGHHGPDNYLSNVGPLLRYGPRYTDDGDALGALIQAGTHDLRGTDLALANDAPHAVIQARPDVQGRPRRRRQARARRRSSTTTSQDFEYVAMERAEPGPIAAPRRDHRRPDATSRATTT